MERMTCVRTKRGNVGAPCPTRPRLRRAFASKYIIREGIHERRGLSGPRLSPVFLNSRAGRSAAGEGGLSIRLAILVDKRLSGETHLAVVVDLEQVDLYLVAHFEVILNVLNVVVVDL